MKLYILIAIDILCMLAIPATAVYILIKGTN